ncbi:MAG: ATP-binding cassette domain-containing protein [Bacteroidales bacterium]|nr:ATP-binding cassette domain-containing protein [Candidatus Egerieousia equi]
MNDIILSGLINLFALFSSRNKTNQEVSGKLLENYLSRHFGVRDKESYLQLYEDLRNFYDESETLDKEAIVENTCSNLKGSISQQEQALMLLRFMEFSQYAQASDSAAFNSKDPIFSKVAKAFDVNSSLFADFEDFVNEKEGGKVKKFSYENVDGYIKTLYISEFNKMIFTYSGNEIVLYNDVPVLSGIFQIWQQSGVVKLPKGRPVYYTTISAAYQQWQAEKDVQMCGRDINFRFTPGGSNGLHNFSFNLKSGQLVAIMGGSGTGKSTLLSLLNGSNTPQEGSITINGHSISEPEAKALIGFVPQDDLLIEELTVYQNLYYTAKLCFDKMPEEQINQKVLSILTQLGLAAAKDLKVGSAINKYISGGQRKRLNIALELIREPAILFLDEPTSGLSSTDTENVVNLLKEQTCKGKLVVMNIHQPSSDVYKFFDRLWLLDKGGYPVFDGNPIDAISYFKEAAHYADADVATCPTCGNVNPEVVLNIIDEKALDGSGATIEKRKVAPEEWHEMYLNSREKFSEPAVDSVPVTDQKKPNVFKQLGIFFRRNIVSKITNAQYMAITLLEAPLLALIVALLTHFTPDSGTYSVMENKNLVSYMFMAVIVAIFIGMSGSAEEIFKDRALLKREKFLRLSYSSYIWSKILYMAMVCFIQTGLFIVVGNLIMGIHSLFFVWWMILFASAFLAGLTGLLLSQCLNSIVAIYITIPMLLIPQILLCGLVVKFEDLNPNSNTGNVPLIGEVIPSRWSYEALATASFSLNDYERNIFDQDCERYTATYYNKAFLYELRSRLEKLEDSRLNNKEYNDIDFLTLNNELPHLAKICKMPLYSGMDQLARGKYTEKTYPELEAWLDEAEKYLQNWGNKTTLRLDKQVTQFMKEVGADVYKQRKVDEYNITLEDMVLNRDTDKTHKVVDGYIIPKAGYIFLEPRSHNGRAPFYSGVKILGNTRIPTLWFNMCVILIMCVICATALLHDFPGRYLRKERN